MITTTNKIISKLWHLFIYAIN